MATAKSKADMKSNAGIKSKTGGKFTIQIEDISVDVSGRR